MTILHHFTPLPSLLVPLSLLLLLLDPVPLVLTPGVVGRRASIYQLIQQPVLPTSTVLPCPEHRKVGLQGLQQLIHHITACLGTFISEGVMVTTLATTVMMSTSMMMMSVSTMWSRTRSSISQNSVM